MGDKLKRAILPKLVLTSLSLLVMVSCDPGGVSDLRSSNGSKTANALVPSYWPSSAAFPLNVRVSTAFSGAETDSIRTSADSWSTAVSNKETFFSTANTTTEKSSSLGSYNDGLLGVYKLTSWPSELEPTALAVTQLFGVRKNIGTSSEVIEISHADILVNYDNFSFSTDGGSGYDLETVVLHEFGHFLGLGHDDSAPSLSVMYPSISSFTQSREPKSNDSTRLENLYKLSGQATASNANFRGLASVKSEQQNEEDEYVVIQYELRADGTEKVKMNNKYVKNYKCKHKK